MEELTKQEILATLEIINNRQRLYMRDAAFRGLMDRLRAEFTPAAPVDRAGGLLSPPVSTPAPMDPPPELTEEDTYVSGYVTPPEDSVPGPATGPPVDKRPLVEAPADEPVGVPSESPVDPEAS